MTESYTVIRKLGQGGFGHVFLVKNRKNENYVIKTIPLKENLKYIISEFNIMKSLDHPRIIKFVDFFPSNKGYNFVMEHAKNGTLRELICKYQNEKWKMLENDFMEIFTEIAHGLAYLHAQKIIHRDVKPENILMCEAHRAKLADFGVSKIAELAVPDHHTSIGTLCYMSPEVYLNKPYDYSCDIWALGLIFYEIAMMKYPFDRVDKTRILNSLLTYECPKIDCIQRKYDPKVQEILEMMLQRDPSKRRKMIEIFRHPLVFNFFKTLETEWFLYRNEQKEKIASMN